MEQYKGFFDIFTGGFYQDEIGQVVCKRCSIGTFVSEKRAPGTTATDCWACPYGKKCVLSRKNANIFQITRGYTLDSLKNVKFELFLKSSHSD